MRAIFKPASGLLNKLSFASKFSIITIAFVVPTALGVGAMYQTSNKSIIEIEQKSKTLELYVQMQNYSTTLAEASDPEKSKDALALQKKASSIFKDINDRVAELHLNFQEFSNMRQAQTELDKLEKANVAAILNTLKKSNDFMEKLGMLGNLHEEHVQVSHVINELLSYRASGSVYSVADLRSQISAKPIVKNLTAEERVSILNKLELAKNDLMSYQKTLSQIANVKSELADDMLKGIASVKQASSTLKQLESQLSDSESQLSSKQLSSVISNINDISNKSAVLLDKEFESVKTRQNTFQTQVLGVYLATVVLALYLLFGFYFNVTESVNLLVRRLSNLSNGNLTDAPISDIPNDELGQIMQSAEKMTESLTSIVGDSLVNSQAVYSTAKQIATDTAYLAQSTEQQTDALHQVKDRMHDLTGTVRQNVENASTASDVAKDAAGVAQRGNEAMEDVVATMENVQEASLRVSEIVQVIQDIANRTDILAINATIEAARAGDAGKGFAVVATEVRKLSVRSSQAALEIQALVKDVTDQVHISTEKLVSAQDTLSEIVKKTHRVNNIMSAIETASKEQNHGIDEATKALSIMRQVSEKSKQLVESTASTAGTLQKSATELKDNMSVFKVDTSKLKSIEPLVLTDVVEYPKAKNKAFDPNVTMVQTPVAEVFEVSHETSQKNDGFQEFK